MAHSSDDAVRAAQALLRSGRRPSLDHARLTTAPRADRSVPLGKPQRSFAGRAIRFIAIALAVIVAWNVLCGLLVVGAIVGGFFGYAVQHVNERAIALPASVPALQQAASRVPSLPTIAPHGATAIVTTVLVAIIAAIAVPVAFLVLIAWRLWITLPAIAWRLWALHWMFGLRGRRN